jgi:hypothetical protein
VHTENLDVAIDNYHKGVRNCSIEVNAVTLLKQNLFPAVAD